MKDKLKEMNGKYYQECEIVMLATNEKATERNYALLLGDSGKLYSPQAYTSSFKPQHLYFLSKEEIKEGDYVIDSMGELFGPYEKGDIIGKEAKKIIATTDTSLKLPQPSKEFIKAYIKAYNEGKPITKVLVEMSASFDMSEQYELTPILKVNSSNEITIKKIKNSYTREEVIELLSKHFVQAGSKIGLGQDVTKFTKNWIEENL